MSKSQIIITITGIISVILLFSLPKIIVKSEKELAVEKQDSSTVAPNAPAMKDIHKVKVSENEISNINRWRKSYVSVLNKEKKTNFADSLVKAYRKIHQYDSAAKYSEEVSTLNPSIVNWSQTADIYTEAFNFASDAAKPLFCEKAREYYNKILVKEPANLEVKSKLALTYIGGDNPMQGIKLLREVLEVDPKNESALYDLGILSIQSKQYDKAVKRFEELLKVNPNHSTGQFYLGVALANMGDKSKALAAFEKARKLDSDPEFRATVDSYIKELQ
ncbi:MAG TPA: tetratricopeptide repeat protein [Cytophagaceae bacterium]|jgi:tetratricopeptide (TPR) repeat protein|nr:tetratricopeptide repeat protein [Cytophagaceae bacterium]